MKLVKSIIDQFSKMNGLSLTFGGGECLLHPNFSELLNYARSNDLMVTLLSNVTDLKENVLNSIRNAKISQIQVSVYSLNASEHDYITRVPGSLKKTMESIEELIKRDVPVQISCPIMKINYKSYKDVLNWAQNHGMKANADFIMMARSDFSKDNLSERLNDKQTRSLIKDIVENDNSYKESIEETKEPLDTDDDPVCGVGRGTLTIGSDGLCYPCSGWQGMVVGDIKIHLLNDIWNNSSKLKMLRKVSKKDFPKCRTCPDKGYCAMCLVRNFNESEGNMMSVAERYCQVARINREEVEKWTAR
jgi:radical SAM protein with 4Fe4S-binding SPASM domain